MVAIGELKSNIRFEKSVATTNDLGRKVEAYEGFLTTKGRLRKLSGNRPFIAFQSSWMGKWELVVRWQQQLENQMWKSNRVLASNNRVYSIEEVHPVDEERKRWMVFILNESSSQ